MITKQVFILTRPFWRFSISLEQSTIRSRWIHSGTVQHAEEKSQDSAKATKISRAMREYVRKAEEYTNLMESEQFEYELGKRHLANIMGFDPETISQQQIDASISYLLPSGMFEPRARPLMKAPEEIFPKRKPAQFGIDGRPYHYLFYTSKPSFFALMHEGANWLKKLDELPRKDLGIDADSKNRGIDLTGSDWIDLSSIRALTLENVDEADHKVFVGLLSRIASHSNAENARQFLFKYRLQLTAEKPAQLRLPLSTDSEGKQYVDSFGSRKWARADVRLFSSGSGRAKVNGQSLLNYFPGSYEREQVLFPLQFTGMLGKVDFVANINSGASGPMSEAGALRLALSRALCSICSDEVVDGMRLAGLLTRDNRRRERKKPGQVGARRKFTWVKR